MKHVGEKINRLRIDKGYSQESIYANQSLISQIESGKIRNPKESILREIAEGLDVTFEDLIEDTDWESKEAQKGTIAYAIDPTQVKVTMDEKGNWDYSFLHYPLNTAEGQENRYSPISGEPLITKCSSCDRSIQSLDCNYCMTCGTRLMPDYAYAQKKEYLINQYMAEDISKPDAREYVISQLENCAGDWHHQKSGKDDELQIWLDINIQIAEGLIKRLKALREDHEEEFGLEEIQIETYKKCAQLFSEVGESLITDLNFPVAELLGGTYEKTKDKRDYLMKTLTTLGSTLSGMGDATPTELMEGIAELGGDTSPLKDILEKVSEKQQSSVQTEETKSSVADESVSHQPSTEEEASKEEVSDNDINKEKGNNTDETE